MQSGVCQSVITNLKLNNFKERNPKENVIAISHSPINADEYGSAKFNTFRIKRGSRSIRNFEKKSNKMEASSYFFLLFGKAP